MRKTLKLMYSKILFTLKIEVSLLSAVTIARYSLPPYCSSNTLYTTVDLHIFLREPKINKGIVPISILYTHRHKYLIYMKRS